MTQHSADLSGEERIAKESELAVDRAVLINASWHETQPVEADEYNLMVHIASRMLIRLDEASSELASLRSALAEIRAYSTFDAKGCTLCTLDAGVLVKACGYHEELLSAQAECASLRSALAEATGKLEYIGGIATEELTDSEEVPDDGACVCATLYDVARELDKRPSRRDSSGALNADRCFDLWAARRFIARVQDVLSNDSPDSVKETTSTSLSVAPTDENATADAEEDEDPEECCEIVRGINSTGQECDYGCELPKNHPGPHRSFIRYPDLEKLFVPHVSPEGTVEDSPHAGGGA